MYGNFLTLLKIGISADYKVFRVQRIIHHPLANIRYTIILFVCLPKTLHKHCFYFLLGFTIFPRETGNNAYAKFWVDKQRILWCF